MAWVGRAVFAWALALVLFALGLEMSLPSERVSAQSAGVTISSTTVTISAEGGSGSYTVVLDTAPTAEVTVTPSSNNTDVIFTPSHLTFTTSNWSTAQTVTVWGLHDDDLANDTSTVSHAVTGYGTVTSGSDVTVTVTDNDTGTISVFPTNLSVKTGTDHEFYVSLSHKPTSNVTISVPSPSAQLSVSPTSLTFTPSDWAPKTVTVRPSSSGSRTIVTGEAQGAGSGYAGTNPTDVTVVGISSSTRYVRVSKSGLTPTEGGTATFDVRPNSFFSGTATVNITSPDSGAVTVSPSQLSFTSGTSQTVTVTGVQDNDAADEEVTLGITTTGYSTDLTPTVKVRVEDDDTGGLTIAPSGHALTIAENANGSYTVKLATQPTGPVTVTITDPAGTEITSSPDTLMFTTSNWNIAKTVTVSVGQDTDASSDVASIIHTFSGGGYDEVNAPAMVVTATEVGVPGFSFSPSAITVAEGGSGTFDVELAAQPSANVTVTLTSDNSDVTIDTDTGTDGNQNTLTFTGTTWNTSQSVSVAAAEDDDTVDDDVTISHSASGGGYDSVTGDVDVTVTDDDSPDISFSSRQISLNEGQNTSYTLVLDHQPTSSVTVTITSNNSDVSVDTKPAAGNQNTLTFTTGNWDTAQTVTVKTVDDADASDDSATLSHAFAQSGGSMEYNGFSTNTTVSVSVTDQDTAGVTSNPSSPNFTITEQGTGTGNLAGTASWTLVLDTQPSGTVTITPTLPANSPLTITAGSSLSFTSTTWNTAQTVTVRADNDDDAANNTYTITHTVSGYGTVTSGPSVSLTVNDDDTKGITASTLTGTATEGGNTTYTLKLATKPVGGNVTIGLTSDDTARATVSPSSLTFSATTWNTAQTVTITAVQDGDIANNTVNISHTVSGADYDDAPVVTLGDFVATITDDDTGSLVLSKTSSTITETDGTATDTYTAKLSHKPTGTVTVTITDDNDDVTMSPDSLDFTGTTWNTAQTVTISVAHDDDGKDESATISHAVAQTEGLTEWNGLSAGSVSVSITDDDEPDVIADPTSQNVPEGGSRFYNVKLATKPSHDVTVAIAVSNTGLGITTSKTSLTFTSTDWNTNQGVRVDAAEDNGNTVNETTTITHTATSTDTDYNNLSGDSVSITANDNDTANANPSRTTIPGTGTNSLTEGSTATYTLKLGTQPNPSNQNVTITITQPTNTDVTIDTDTVTAGNQNTLTFTGTTWNTAQTVTVSAVDDADAVVDTATISHSASGADYTGITISDVSVAVGETDSVGVTISPTSLTILEKDDGTATGTYTVVLTSAPSGGDAVIDVTKSGTGASDLTISSNALPLRFNSSNWNTAQTVTLTLANDFTAEDESVTLEHRSRNSGDYKNMTFDSVAVTITDNDTRGFTLTPASGTTNLDGSIAMSGNENTNLPYTIVMDTQPTANVSVQTEPAVKLRDPDRPFDGELFLSDGITPNPNYNPAIAGGVFFDYSATGTGGEFLTFTPTNWNTAQTVTLRVAYDLDAKNDEYTVTAIVTGADYEANSVAVPNVTVTSQDIDSVGYYISRNILSPFLGIATPDAQGIIELSAISEGVTDTHGRSTGYAIWLQSEPSPYTDTITITPTSSDPGVRIHPTSHSFGPNGGSTATPATFDVISDEDANVVSETVDITHTVTNVSTGSDYASATVPTVRVRVNDNDTPRANLSAPSGGFTVDEGQGAQYTIDLSFQPASNVVITPSSTNPDLSITPSTVTFTPSTWNTAQTIQFSVAEDDTDVQDETATIRHSASGGGVTLNIDSVTVRITDNDQPELNVGTQTMQLAEGGTGTYALSLGVQPSANVTVTVGSDNSDVRVSPSSFTFTSASWDTPQIVTVNALDDADANRDEATITHTGSGAQFTDPITGAPFAGPTIQVLVIEDGTDAVNDSSFLRASACDGELLLSWNAPVGQGEEIAYFEIQPRDASGSPLSRIFNVDAGTKTHTLSTLTNGATYEIEITGFDGMGLPLWSQTAQGVPEAGACISNVTFGNILADSTPVIVEVAPPVTQPILVNMQWRSLNPGQWSDTFTQLLETGETTATFDIKGLHPSSKYELRTWTGPSRTPPSTGPGAQVVFTSGSLPEGTRFTPGGGGGGSISRVLRIEPAIRSVTISDGDSVLLQVDAYGRQGIRDNGLLDKNPADDRPDLVWDTDGGGYFSEAKNIRSEWKNGLPDDRQVLFTASGASGTYRVTAGFANDFVCLAAQDDESNDDYLARCGVVIEVTIRRSSTIIPPSITAPVNPPGTIPETLTDSDGTAYAVFTPVEDGSFVGDGYSVSADAGAVANGELIGISMTPGGNASNVGKTWHRYTLAGLNYAVRAVDSQGQKISDYQLIQPLNVCAPVPSRLRANISTLALVATDDSDQLTVLSTQVKIQPHGGVSACGNLSTLPVDVAVGSLGPPPANAAPESDDTTLEEFPDTGGTAIPLPFLLTLILIGTIATLYASITLTSPFRQRPSKSDILQR